MHTLSWRNAKTGICKYCSDDLKDRYMRITWQSRRSPMHPITFRPPERCSNSTYNVNRDQASVDDDMLHALDGENSTQSHISHSCDGAYIVSFTNGDDHNTAS